MDDWRTVKTNKSLIHCFLLGWRRGFRGDLTSLQIQDHGDVQAHTSMSYRNNQSKPAMRLREAWGWGAGEGGDLAIHPDFHGLAQWGHWHFQMILVKAVPLWGSFVDECYPPKTQSIWKTLFRINWWLQIFHSAPISYFWIKLEQLDQGQAHLVTRRSTGDAHLSKNMCLKLKKLLEWIALINLIKMYLWNVRLYLYHSS